MSKFNELPTYLYDTYAGVFLIGPGGNIEFSYNAGYSGPPISASMPVKGKTKRVSGEILNRYCSVIDATTASLFDTTEQIG